MTHFKAVLAVTALLGGGSCQEETDLSPDEGLARRHSHHFDFLMFTQIWPITSCLTWEDRGYQHTCTIDGMAPYWLISFFIL